MFKTTISRTLLALALLVGAAPGAARAEVAEDLVVPSFRQGNLSGSGGNIIQFKVPDRGVNSVSVLVRAHARDGRVDQQLFELTPQSSKGAFPRVGGHQIWESDKIYAALDQWAGNRQNLDRVEFSYVVHKVGQGQQRTALESRHRYLFASNAELRGQRFAASTVARAGDNPGYGLDRLDPAQVQAAVDRLAKKAPAANYTALPGGYPHPLHPQNRMVKAIQSLTKAKQAHPERDYFIRFSIYNQDSTILAGALVAAKRAGVRVEGLTDWSQVTPRLAGKQSHEQLRAAGVPMINLVRNGPGNGDIRTNHTKFWIMGQLERGQIVRGTTFDCSFNTEFQNYPGNQEAMTEFRNNRDVATVYNHIFQAMKGNAPLRLTVDPDTSHFILSHPKYPYVTREGRSFDARSSLYTFINKARRNLTMLDYVHADRDIAGATGARAQKGARVDVFLNGWKVKNSGGAENANLLRSMGANVHLVLKDGASPVHHKEGVADGKWVRGGSLNPGWWSFDSDETMYVIRSPKLAKQVLAQANKLAHNYQNEQWGGSQAPAKQTQNVQFEVRVPRGIAKDQIQGVYFAGGGSSELGGSWVKLEPAAKAKRVRQNKDVYRGSRRLPLGFVHQGKAVIVLRNGQQLFSNVSDTHFSVQPRASGRQRVRVGFKR